MAIKYLEIARDIRQKVLSGEWKPRQQLPTREELVRQYQTSKATMQKTINTLLAEGCLQTSNKSGTFVTDTPPNLYSIAIVFPVNEADPGYSDSLWTGLMRQHRYLEGAFGRRFIYCRFDDSNVEHEEFQQVIRDAESLRLAGIIFCDRPSPIAIKALRHLNIPRVALCRDEIPSFNLVHADFSLFFRSSLEHLAGCGRSRIAMIVNPEMSPVRTTECRQLASDMGLVMPPEWELGVGLRFHVGHWVRNLVRLLFKVPPGQRPDGLIVGNENHFEHVMNALQLENLVPGRDLDLAVHANFPTVNPKHHGVKRIGFDVRDIIETCIATIDASGAENFPVPLKLVKPVVEK